MFSAAKRSSHMIWFQLFGILVALTEDHDLFNLSRNIVALQVEQVNVACITTACSTCFVTTMRKFLKNVIRTL